MNDFSIVGNYDTVKVFEEGCIYCQTLWFTNKFEELNILCKRVPNQFELLAEELTRDGTYLTFYNQGKVVNKMRTIANHKAIKHLHDTGILDENYKEVYEPVNENISFVENTIPQEMEVERVWF